MRSAAFGVVLVLALVSGVPSRAEAQQPFEEGPVVNVSHIRTHPGQFGAYMNYIFGDYARIMEAQKAAGIILDWGVFTMQTRNADEPNVILTTTYANLAALDNLQARTGPITQQVLGSGVQGNQAAMDRDRMRTVLGSQLIRRLNRRP